MIYYPDLLCIKSTRFRPTPLLKSSHERDSNYPRLHLDHSKRGTPTKLSLLIMSNLLRNAIPKTGQQVTKLGFGSYRASSETHARALTAALEGGINIIDTGNNFENGIYQINQIIKRVC
jgi:hypothetical protein